MKKILTLIFCIFISFSSLCFAEKRRTNSVKTQPTVNDFPNIFRPIGNLFKKILGKEAEPIRCGVWEISSVNLSQLEVFKNWENSQKIQVESSDTDPELDIYDYRYTVSGGEIMGKGPKVIWDLSNVKAGNYTITAELDSGCNFCGRKIIKMISVKECPDCK